MTKTDYELARIVKHYHRGEYRQITDYDLIASLAQTVEGNIKAYQAPGQTIYLDTETGYAVNYGRQKVDPEGNLYLYNFTDDPNPEDEDIAFEYVCEYEWKNTSLPWLDPLED